MKKLYILFTAASFTAAACTSNLEIDTPDVTPEDNTPEVVDPDNDGTNDGLVPLTFSIAAEGMTKTTIGGNKTDGYTVSWATGDKVRIVWNDGSKSAQTSGEDYYIADVNAKTGEVAGYIPAGSADEDVFYAVYPETADYTLEDGTLTITIPREQSGTFKDANIMVAKTTKAQAHLAFKNMTSIISFSTSASMKSDYKYITFAANQLNTYKLSGTVSTDFNGELFSVTTNASNSYVSKRSGKLSCGNAYYLAILPGADIENGLGFKLEDKDYGLICGGISKVTFSRARGAVASLGAIDTKVRESWFIKQDGSDTGGKDWDNAGNARRLVELLSPSYSDNGTTAGWRLTGATIYVAGGEYNLQAYNSGNTLNLHWGATGAKVRVKGGCTGSGTSRDIDNVTTSFVCNQNATTDHIFEITGTVDSLTVDGVTFTANSSATEPAISGIALSCSSTSEVEVTFNKCTFSGITGSNTKGGSVVDVTGTPSINFTSCNFKNNTTSGAENNYGGAIMVDNGSATVNFTDCIADNNDVTSEKGRAGFLCLRNGTVTINGGTIKNSNANGAAGAVFVNNSAAVLNMNNCTVQKNSSSYGGFLYLGGGTVNIKGGTFEENSAAANAGGAIYLNSGTLNIDDYENTGTSFVKNTASSGGAIYSKSAVSISKASFSNNDATANGGAIHTDGACTLTVDSCDITGNSASGGNGGGINVNGVATSIVVKNSSITDNTAKIGGGINITQTTANYVPVTIYNTAITGNTATGGAGGVYSRGKNDLIMVNCTVSGNTGTNAGGIYVTRQDNDTYKANITRLAMISCTVTGNTASDGTGGIYKETFGQVVDVYNSIISGNTGTSTNDDVRNDRLLYRVDKSIVVATSYTSANRVKNTDPDPGNFVWRKPVLSDPSAFDLNTMLSALSNGVHTVLTVDDNPALSCGMTSDELSGLTLKYTPTQTVDTSFLTIDQKGNDRNGTIMGAYVGN